MWRARPRSIIVKTVAALLNTRGGTLLIGVADDGSIHGLARDYEVCGNKGRDGFELWLTNLLLKDFGKDAADQLALTFHTPPAPGNAPGSAPGSIASHADAERSEASGPPVPGSLDVCRVVVEPSPKPRFVTEENKERFYIRTGNATHELKLSEYTHYLQSHWPGGNPMG